MDLGKNNITTHRTSKSVALSSQVSSVKSKVKKRQEFLSKTVTMMMTMMLQNRLVSLKKKTMVTIVLALTIVCKVCRKKFYLYIMLA